MATRRPAVSDTALLAAWQAVPAAERHSFVCEALAEDAALQLLRALSDRQPDEPAPLPDAEGLRELWESESAQNTAARRGRAQAGPADPAEVVEQQRARNREAARRHRERQRAQSGPKAGPKRAQAAPAAD